jgi:hypothetical protein
MTINKGGKLKVAAFIYAYFLSLIVSNGLNSYRD